MALENTLQLLSPWTACGATKLSINSTTTSTTTTTTTNNNNSSSSDNNRQTPGPPHPVETALSTSVVHCTWTSRVQDCRPQEFRRYTVPCTSGMQSHSRHWVHLPPHPQPKWCSSACILEGGFDLPTHSQPQHLHMSPIYGCMHACKRTQTCTPTHAPCIHQVPTLVTHRQ